MKWVSNCQEKSVYSHATSNKRTDCLRPKFEETLSLARLFMAFHKIESLIDTNDRLRQFFIESVCIERFWAVLKEKAYVDVKAYPELCLLEGYQIFKDMPIVTARIRFFRANQKGALAEIFDAIAPFVAIGTTVSLVPKQSINSTDDFLLLSHLFVRFLDMSTHPLNFEYFESSIQTPSYWLQVQLCVQEEITSMQGFTLVKNCEPQRLAIRFVLRKGHIPNWWEQIMESLTHQPLAVSIATDGPALTGAAANCESGQQVLPDADVRPSANEVADIAVDHLCETVTPPSALNPRGSTPFTFESDELLSQSDYSTSATAVVCGTPAQFNWNPDLSTPAKDSNSRAAKNVSTPSTSSSTIHERPLAPKIVKQPESLKMSRSGPRRQIQLENLYQSAATATEAPNFFGTIEKRKLPEMNLRTGLTPPVRIMRMAAPPSPLALTDDDEVEDVNNPAWLANDLIRRDPAANKKFASFIQGHRARHARACIRQAKDNPETFKVVDDFDELMTRVKEMDRKNALARYRANTALNSTDSDWDSEANQDLV